MEAAARSGLAGAAYVARGRSGAFAALVLHAGGGARRGERAEEAYGRPVERGVLAADAGVGKV